MSGPFHGGLTIPLGFALNPRKYHAGLARAAQQAGATLHAHSPVTRLRPIAGRWQLDTAAGSVTADRVLLATNGYSSEDLPDWLAARYLPVQSSVIVTAPLTEAQRQAQGWTSRQMAYDTRQLLHYFRLLPDNRMKGAANVLVFGHADAASGVRNILKMKGGGLEVGPILMGMGNEAHIVTPSITSRGLLNMAAIAGTPVAHYG